MHKYLRKHHKQQMTKQTKVASSLQKSWWQRFALHKLPEIGVHENALQLAFGQHRSDTQEMNRVLLFLHVFTPPWMTLKKNSIAKYLDTRRDRSKDEE